MTTAQQKRKIGKVMHEYKHGELKSGSGKKVKNSKQAIAIALSESGQSRRKTSSTSATRKSSASATRKSGGSKRSTSTARKGAGSASRKSSRRASKKTS